MPANITAISVEGHFQLSAQPHHLRRLRVFRAGSETFKKRCKHLSEPIVPWDKYLAPQSLPPFAGLC